jgi:hypothetical protein
MRKRVNRIVFVLSPTATHLDVIVELPHVLLAGTVAVAGAGRSVPVPAQVGVAGNIDARLLQEVVHATPVLQEGLHPQVVQYEGPAQRGVLLRLVQRVALAEEGHQHVRYRPLRHRLAQDAFVTKEHHLEHLCEEREHKGSIEREEKGR